MGIVGFLVALLIVGFIILIHEFGHYIMGKLSGCSVSRFSVGWGPKLFSFKRKETEYRISCIPLIGGYVKLPGVEEAGGQATDEELEDIKKYKLKTFEELNTRQKFSVFFGGVGLQAIVCAIILSLVVCFMGKPLTKVMVGGVAEDSPAEASGMVIGDIILEADGQEMNSVEELIDFTSDKAGRSVSVIVMREKEPKTLKVVPRYSEKEKRALMGINIAPTLYFDKQSMRWHDYAFGGIVFTGKLSARIMQGLWQLITAQVSLKTSAMGPVRMVAFTKEIVKLGVMQVLLFFAMININLAIINLMPFPALDGGHILFLSIEKLLRVKIKPKVKEIVNTAGFFILIALMLYITFNDVTQLAKGRRQAQQEDVQQKELPLEK
jgi:regulator of sigma E protease